MPFKSKRSLTCCRIVDSLKLEPSHNLQGRAMVCRWVDEWTDNLHLRSK
jgi:hypothetical protein